MYTDQGNVGDIAKQPKELFETVLKRSISLRGDNMYQNFKITKLTPGSGNYLQGKSYMLADFKYQLLTGAGVREHRIERAVVGLADGSVFFPLTITMVFFVQFEVDRKGVASITSEGNGVEALWAASTDIRYKKTEPVLRSIVDSFRCYAEGINFADELVTFDA